MLFIVKQNETDDTAELFARTSEDEDRGAELCQAYAEEQLPNSDFSIKADVVDDWEILSTKQLSRLYTTATGQDPNALFPDHGSALAGVSALLSNRGILDGMKVIPLEWTLPPVAESVIDEAPLPMLIADYPAPALVPSLDGIAPTVEPVPDIAPAFTPLAPVVKPRVKTARKKKQAVEKHTTRPNPGTKAAQLWDLFDDIADDPRRIHLSRKEYIAIAMENKEKYSTVVTQYGVWRSFKIKNGTMHYVDDARRDYTSNNDAHSKAQRNLDSASRKLKAAQKAYDAAMVAISEIETKKLQEGAA